MEIQNDQIRILVATDVHLGHKEQDPIRGNDSYQGLQQVFQNATKHQVDFLLLGGDLFDQVNPSKECYMKCLEIFNQNIFGKKQNNLDVTLNGQPYKANFSLQNVNISLPVFTIHGNHDYPNNNFGKISVCDLLHQSNYVNYFGKQLSLHNILIRPLIISKKNCKTKIALYGLGYIKDPVLNDLFQYQKAVFEKPKGDINDYFTIFITHQNRYKKTSKTGVPLSLAFRPQNIPNWINLTLWCHQHEAIYKKQIENDRQIYQPGSTVITSLIQTESKMKQCVLVKVNHTKYSIEPVLLNKSYRPMFCFNYEARKIKEEFIDDNEFYKFLDQKIADTIKESQKIMPHKKPIIRIKMQFLSSEQMFRSRDIENKYQSRVANSLKIFSFKRQKKVEVVPQIKNEREEKETLEMIRQKKAYAMPSAITEAFHNLLKQNLARQKLQFFPYSYFDDIFSSVTPLMTQGASTASTNALIGKYMSDITEKIDKHKCNKIEEMDQKIMNQTRLTLKQHIEQVQKDVNIVNQKVKKSMIKPKQQQNYTKDILTEEKFYQKCKYMEDLVSINTIEIFNNQPYQFENRSSSQRPSKIKLQRDSFDLDFNRSESEDCCEKASKQQINEQRNKVNFQKAKVQIQDASLRKRKKNDNRSKNYIKKDQQQPKVKKNRANQDFK